MRYLLISQLFLLDSNEIEWIEALNELRIFLKIKKKKLTDVSFKALLCSLCTLCSEYVQYLN